MKTWAGEASAPGSFLRVKGFIFFFCVSQRGAGIPRASGRGLLTSGWAGPVQSPSPGYTEPIQDTLHPPFLISPLSFFPFSFFFMVLGVTHTIYKGTTTEPHLTLHNLPSPWFKAPFHNLIYQITSSLPHPVDQMHTTGYRHPHRGGHPAGPEFRGLGITVAAFGSVRLRAGRCLMTKRLAGWQHTWVDI